MSHVTDILSYMTLPNCLCCILVLQLHKVKLLLTFYILDTTKIKKDKQIHINLLALFL